MMYIMNETLYKDEDDLREVMGIMALESGCNSIDELELDIEEVTDEDIEKFAMEYNPARFRVWGDIEELIEECGLSPVEAARAVFFGDVQNWCDDYFRFDGGRNIESLSRGQYEAELDDYGYEIIKRAMEDGLL